MQCSFDFDSENGKCSRGLLAYKHTMLSLSRCQKYVVFKLRQIILDTQLTEINSPNLFNITISYEAIPSEPPAGFTAEFFSAVPSNL